MSVCRCILVASALLVACFGGVSAQPAPDDPYRFGTWIVDDLQAFLPAVKTQGTLLAAGGTLAVLVPITWQDEAAVSRVVRWSDEAPHLAFRIVNELGNVRAVRPVAAMLFLGALTGENTKFQDASFTALEAIVISNLVTDLLKSATGRARPWQNEGPRHFRPLSSRHLSFPSGHATTVFAFTTPWALYYPGYRMYALVLFGASTSFVRLAEQAHWLTDVLAGGAIGFTVGYWLTRRHQQAASRLRLDPVFSANQVGLRLRF